MKLTVASIVIVVIGAVLAFQNCGPGASPAAGFSVISPSGISSSVNSDYDGVYNLTGWLCGSVNIFTLLSSAIDPKKATFTKSGNSSKFVYNLGGTCSLTAVAAFESLPPNQFRLTPTTYECSSGCSVLQCKVDGLPPNKLSAVYTADISGDGKTYIYTRTLDATMLDPQGINYTVLGCKVGDLESMRFLKQ